jgi:hypothetical protein
MSELQRRVVLRRTRSARLERLEIPSQGPDQEAGLSTPLRELKRFKNDLSSAKEVEVPCCPDSPVTFTRSATRGSLERVCQAFATILEQVTSENERYLARRRGRPVRYKVPESQIHLLDLFQAPEGHSDHLAPPTRSEIFKFVYVSAYRTRSTNEAVIQQLILLDKLIARTSIVVSRHTWRRAVFSTLLISQKLSDDSPYSNADYTMLIDAMNLDEVNQLELAHCLLTSFEYYISPVVYSQYVANLASMFARDLCLHDSVPDVEPLTPLASAKQGIRPIAFDADIIGDIRNSLTFGDSTGKEAMADAIVQARESVALSAGTEPVPLHQGHAPSRRSTLTRTTSSADDGDVDAVAPTNDDLPPPRF